MFFLPDTNVGGEQSNILFCTSDNCSLNKVAFPAVCVMGGCVFSLPPSLTCPRLCEPNSQRGAFPAGLFSPRRSSPSVWISSETLWHSSQLLRLASKPKKIKIKNPRPTDTDGDLTNRNVPTVHLPGDYCYSNQTERITPRALKLSFFHFLVCLTGM